MSPSSSLQLPVNIATKLNSIRRRNTLLTILRAALVGGAVLFAMMVLAMSVDWIFTLFDVRVRIALTTASLCLAVGTALVQALQHLRASSRLLRAAEAAEACVPQLEERWMTVASCAVSNHRPANPTAQFMLQQVTSEAVALERLVEPRRVVRPTAVRPALLAAGGSLLLFTAFLTLDWEQTSVLLQRFWQPASPITATHIRLLQGDMALPQGELLELQGELSGMIPAAALLAVKYDSGVQDVFALTPDDNHLCTQALRAEKSFRYRMQAGDGRSAWSTVRVLEYPGFDEIQLTVTAPEYVRRPVIAKALLPARLKVVAGSRLRLRMKPDAPVQRCAVELVAQPGSGEARSRTVVLAPAADGWYEYRVELIEDVSLSPLLTSPDGLVNEDRTVCRVQVVADQAPVARVLSPSDEMAVATDDVIDIKFEAHDDHGVATAELVVYDETDLADGESPRILRSQPISLDEQTLKKHVMGSVKLDLRELNLPEGTQISYAIRVTDNRELTVSPDRIAGQSPPEAPDDRPSAKLAARQPSARQEGDAGRRNDNAPPREGTPEDNDSVPQSPAAAEHAADGARENPAEVVSLNDKPGAAELPVNSAVRSTENTEVSQSASPSGSGSPAKTSRSSERPDAAKTPSRASNDATGAPLPPTLRGAGNDPAAELIAAKSEPDQKTQQSVANPADARVPANTSANSVSTESSGNPPPPGNNDRSTAAGSSADPRRTGGEAGRSPDDERSPSRTGPDRSTNSLTDQPSAGAGEETQTQQTRTAESGPDPSPQQSQSAAQPSNGAQPAAPQSSGSNQIPVAGEPPADSQMADPNSKDRVAAASSPLPENFVLRGQPSESGQNTETQRRRLKIAARLAAVARSTEQEHFAKSMREQVLAIDAMLAGAEAGLNRLVRRLIPDADRGPQYRLLDEQLGRVEEFIGRLRKETKDTEFAFVGLQMMDIAQSRITPARDRVFAGFREPVSASTGADEALHHVLRARELLAALLKRYDAVRREQELKQEIDQSITMYEVYVEKMQRLLREARQTRNPLERKMAVLEVEQDYLDRVAEVQALRREMLQELAHMLGNDPRLRSRYLDVIRRRRASLRDQLGELAERQEAVSTELSSWLAVDKDQQADVWALVTELRLQTASDLARDAAQLDERVQQQLPLVLDQSRGSAREVLAWSAEIARGSRQVALDAREILRGAADVALSDKLVEHARTLLEGFDELQAALDHLQFDHDGDEEIAAYVPARLLEARAVMNSADDWLQIATAIRDKRYAGLAGIDQQKLALATQFLLVDMLDLEQDIAGEFSRFEVNTVPGDILDLVRELQGIIETLVSHQRSATFALTIDRLPAAEVQELAALEDFQRAEQLFDKLRKALAEALDEFDVPDPNIADLRDPTLDEFLAQLEREPDVEAQLGLPARPSNLRIVQDMVTLSEESPNVLGQSSDEAAQRARRLMQQQKRQEQERQRPMKPDEELSEEERQQRQRQQETEDMLQKSLAAIRERQADPETPAGQQKELEQLRRRLERLKENLGERTAEAEEWQKRAEGDEAAAILAALARGERLPDQQWNKLLSTLDDGLWQVEGKILPEAYRRAIEQYQDRLRQLTNGAGE